MADNQISGEYATVGYAFEAVGEYNNPATSHAESTETYVAFGRKAQCSISRSNNKERVYSVGNRNAQATVTKQFTGTATVNGILTNVYWLLGVLGANVDAGTTGSYTHTYTETNVQPTITIKRTMDFGDTKGTETMVGGVISNTTIRAAVGEGVTFNLEIPYRYEADPDESTTITEIFDTEEVFIFSGASIEAPTGTELAGIESFELVIDNGVDLETGLGSRYAEAVTSKQREYNISYTAQIKDYTELKRFLATDEVATLTMNFENGAGDTVVITFTNFHVNEDTLPTNPTEIVKEDCSGWAHACTSAIYTNTVETAPKQAS